MKSYTLLMLVPIVMSHSLLATAEDRGLSAYLNADSKMVLDDLIVYANPKESKEQESAANKMVTRIWKSLGAGEGVGVNFDFPFAPNSSILTADGYQLLGLVARAISILDNEIAFEIQTHKNSSETLSQARLSSMMSALSNRYKLKNRFMVNSYSRQTSPSINAKIKPQNSVQSGDIWRVTIVNKGRIDDIASVYQPVWSYRIAKR